MPIRRRAFPGDLRGWLKKAEASRSHVAAAVAECSRPMGLQTDAVVAAAAVAGRLKLRGLKTDAAAAAAAAKCPRLKELKTDAAVAVAAAFATERPRLSGVKIVAAVAAVVAVVAAAAVLMLIAMAVETRSPHPPPRIFR